ncbi:Non-heme 11 kDa protein of cytochrome bc1 complex [Butyriboletus roseoflavus]|nr:Non-heme 11 kDa protein of cytochrome bc1 complex [Butyriboletus roseoflavus]
MSLSSFFSSFLNVVHADAEEKEEVIESTQAEEVEQAEEEAEEPEDLQPAIQDECKSSTKCAPLTRHFEHCQQKVSAGEGYKGEDCVEELCMFTSSFSSLKPN